MTDTAGPAPRPLYSEAYSNWVVVALMLVYTSNFIDRTIVATISQAIKIDMKITDFQVGLLGGLSFAILYTILAVPLARVADRHNRVTIISVSLAVWSGMTALCGLASNFLLLLLCRVGVGIGEAGCSPSAQSLIADYYTPAKRATALSIYSFGIPLGAMIGAISGGLLTQSFGWRVAFVVVGLPGLLLAVLVKATVREPPRGYSEPSGTVDATPAPSLPAVARRLFGSRSFRHMTAGVTLVSFAGYGIGAFANLYFQRRFGLNYAQVGVIFGLIGGISTGAGTILGGWIADRLGRADWRWYAWTPAIGVAVAAPLSLAVYLVPSWTMAAAIAILPGVFGYTYLGPTWGVLHNLVEPRSRATATALLFFVLNLIALGGGPPITGALIDVIGRRLFAMHGLGDFLVQCPGGLAAHPAMTLVCHATLWRATQYGIILTMITYVWGSLHYVAAARTIRADMAAAGVVQAQA
ncbi:MAG TPA: MFS transporter [Caulobacteraceae bacterium]|jgi:MFS family permease|nr:MFS transporter [Caulobacteraceae bacterium]